MTDLQDKMLECFAKCENNYLQTNYVVDPLLKENVGEDVHEEYMNRAIAKEFGRAIFDKLDFETKINVWDKEEIKASCYVFTKDELMTLIEDILIIEE